MIAAEPLVAILHVRKSRTMNYRFICDDVFWVQCADTHRIKCNSMHTLMQMCERSYERIAQSSHIVTVRKMVLIRRVLLAYLQNIYLISYIVNTSSHLKGMYSGGNSTAQVESSAIQFFILRIIVILLAIIQPYLIAWLVIDDKS
jgi:hypothetical protein